jgi:RNA polymerase sigma factor (sigma-70 family)
MAARTAVITRLVGAVAKAELAALSDRDLLARFSADRDEAAFAAVVERHTNMVLCVCRRALPRTADPEDACQAVFLLLAQRARGTRWQASVAGWLYTAARKVAHNARVAAERRARRESRAAVPEAVSPPDEMTARELAAALDAELDRLPPRYRDPLVLCYLEGLTQDEAAARLRVPQGTLKSQLKRGRKKLADALTARGWELGVVLLAAAAASAASAAQRKLHGAILAAASGSPSAATAALARGVTVRGMTTATKAVLLVAAGVAALGLGVAPILRTPAQPPPGEQHKAEENAAALVRARIGASRFRAGAPIGDARYAPDGKRVVGYAGGTLYVWDAGDGSRVRTMATGLERLEDSTRLEEKWLAFAASPTVSRVACGGVRDGKTYLQIWDCEAGRLVAEKASSCDALKALAWTPDGKWLLERANLGRTNPTRWKLLVRAGNLDVVRALDLPRDFGEQSTVVQPLPGSGQVILWQARRQPTVLDLASGAVVRTLPLKPDIPSELAVSPDGRTLAATSTEELRLLDLPGGETRRKLPVLRGGWWKPRPLFSPDGATVYVWDHRPIAYDVATGKEKWKATFRTLHTVRAQLCDVSPDGGTVLVRHGRALSRLDARTGTERDPPDAPSAPPDLAWSPDGKTLWTRAERHDRTWTAWDPASGRRLYDLLPAGFVTDDNWKLLPDLFFLPGGKEILAGLEKSESTERVGPKELLVFDAATGRCLRRLGGPLPDDLFQWKHLIGVDPADGTVLMQAFAISAPPGPAGAAVAFDPSREYTYEAIRWDPVRKVKVQAWTARGDRTTPPRHFAPYVVTLGTDTPGFEAPNRKPFPARIRCYGPADGRLAHELQTDRASVDVDRVEGNFLLAVAYDSKWITRDRTTTYTPLPPFAHDLWELPSGEKVRLFETRAQAPVALGPGGRYVLRVVGDAGFEVYEPFVLKKVVATVATPGRVVGLEFSPDGSRVAAALADASVVVWDATPWGDRIGERLRGEVPADVAALWEDLGKDATTGLRAARLLAAAGDRAVALLGVKLDARKAPDDVLLRRLIADLDSPAFATREKAEKGLRDLGGSAERRLRQASRANPSPEVGRRLERLLAALDARQLTAAEVREVRAVQALEWTDSEAARALLAKWARGDPSAALTRASAAAGRGR